MVYHCRFNEQVKADEEELYGTVAVLLLIGDVAEVLLTPIDGNNAYELISSYGVNLFGIDSIVSVTAKKVVSIQQISHKQI